MNNRSRLFLVVASIAGLMLQQPSGASLLRGGVMANGGQSSSPATDGTRKLFGTVGQSGVGVSGSASNIVCHGFWCFGGSRVVSVDQVDPTPGGARLPTEFALGLVTPNPTRDQAHFRLALPKAATVSLSVCDVAGRQVGDVISREMPAGEHDLSWRAPGTKAGVYFLRLLTDGALKARRTIVLVP